MQHHRQRRRVAGAHAHRGQFEVPVGQLVPEEVARLAQRLGELALAQQLVGERDGAFEARQHPAVLAQQPRIADGGRNRRSA